MIAISLFLIRRIDRLIDGLANSLLFLLYIRGEYVSFRQHEAALNENLTELSLRSEYHSLSLSHYSICISVVLIVLTQHRYFLIIIIIIITTGRDIPSIEPDPNSEFIAAADQINLLWGTSMFPIQSDLIHLFIIYLSIYPSILLAIQSLSINQFIR